MDVSPGLIPKLDRESMLMSEISSNPGEERLGPVEKTPSPHAGAPQELNAQPTIHRGSGSSANRRLPGSSILYPIPMPQPGELIDTFLLEESIGVGGMGAVFRALDTRLDRHVALKLLPPDQSSDGEVVRRFYQEGRAAAQLDHENIARVFSIGQDRQYHYIAFEFIDGMSVRQRVDTVGPLPVAEAIDITLQIAYALVHASERGVVHRDIKPSNIVITAKGRAKLVDMGLARNFERGGDHGLTQTGMTLGSFDYISPEQARDPRDVDVRSDLYSLGCTVFHMLTGRPPFPGGTVLQKLIQHQEEAPPEISTLNPAVTPELSAVIMKLLAKDRDRRYQSAEHLVRDLLTIAGSLHVFAPVRESGEWTSPLNQPASDRHLAWILSVSGVLVIAGVLIWWGRVLTQPAPSNELASRTSSQAARDQVLPPANETPVASKTSAEDLVGLAPSAGQYPRTIWVKSTEDLIPVLATAPRRSVIVLTDNGPYRVHGARSSATRPAAALAGLDVTIRADAGRRPVIQLADDASLLENTPDALLSFVGGNVTLEGLEFLVDPVLLKTPTFAISAQRTELTLSGCSFRTNARTPDGTCRAIDLRNIPPVGSAASDRPAAFFAVACHFDGSQTAISARGPADVTLRDCTLGTAKPSLWFNNSQAPASVVAELRLIHTSIALAGGPAIRSEGTLLRVSADDSVIAAATDAPATLVAIDDPRNLTWNGRSNLYSGITTFLASTGGDDRQPSVTDFLTWSEKRTEVRDIDTTVATRPVWQSTEAAASTESSGVNPTQAFLLAADLPGSADRGARRGPFNAVLGNPVLAQQSPNRTTNATLPSNRRATVDGSIAPPATARPLPKRDSVLATNTTAPAGARSPAEQPTPSAPISDQNLTDSSPAQTPPSVSDMPPMQPMPVAKTTDDADEPAPLNAKASAPSTSGKAEFPDQTRVATAPAQPIRDPAPVRDVPAEEDLIRTAEQFQNVWRRIAAIGGVMRLAAGAELELPTMVVNGPGRYEIEAEPSADDRRPKLRLRPSPAANPASADGDFLFDLRSGTLSIAGVDLVIPDTEPLRGSRLAAIGLRPGTSVALSQSTVSVLADRARAERPGVSLFVLPIVNRAELATATEKTGSRAASIRVRNSFLRSAGDGVFIAQGRLLDLQLTDVLVGTDGSLIHAFGAPRVAGPEPVPQNIRIERVTARLRGGLVHLESSPEDRELPPTKIVADHSIFSMADRDEPLFRLTWRDEPGKLRNTILPYEGKNVVYHHVNVYRLDETAQTGVSPKPYTRSDWTNAFLPKDAAPVLEVKFLNDVRRPIAAGQLTRDDLRLAAGAQVLDVGCPPDRVPEPPPVTDRSL